MHMTKQLEACEKELDSYLSKLENAKQALLDAKDAVRKAKISMQDVPEKILNSEFQTSLICVLQQLESEGLKKEETQNACSTTADNTASGSNITKDEKENIQAAEKNHDHAIQAAKPWKERETIHMKVAGSLSVNGTFWCVPEFNDRSSLKAISDRLRKETLSEKLYWNCDASKKDQMICVLSKSHNLWLRGIIEKTLSNNEVLLRYIDIGKTEKVAKSRLNCIPKSMKDLETLALFCCFQKDPISVSYDMRWKFRDLTSKTLAVTVKEEINDGVLPRFVVSIRDPDNDSDDIFQVICKETQSQNTGMASKDMRIYGNVSGNHGQLSIVQEVHNAKQKPEEAPRKEEDVLQKKSEAPCKEIDQEDKKPKAARPELNIDIEEPDGGEPNWADLCKTPDVITNEEQEFLPVDESMFESSDKDDEPDDKEPQSSSGQGKLDSSAKVKAVVDDGQTSDSSGTKKSVDNEGVEDRKAPPEPKAEKSIHNEDQKASSEPKTEKRIDDQCEDRPASSSEPKTEKSVDNKEGEYEHASSEPKADFSEDLNQNRVDVLKISQQVMEERLRAAEELSKKKSLAEKSIEDAKTDSSSSTDLTLENVSHDKLDARTDDSTGESLKEDITSNQEAACMDGEGSREYQHNFQVDDKKTITKEPNVSVKGDDSTITDKGKALSNEGSSKIDEKNDEESLNAEVSSKFENCSVQGSCSKNSETEADACKGLNGESTPDEKLEKVTGCGEIKIVKGVRNKGDSNQKLESSSNDDAPRSTNDVKRTIPSKITSGHADDLKTMPNEDREQWNRIQLKGLQHKALDDHQTRFFIIETKPSELNYSFRTSRFLLTSINFVRDALDKHFPRPVVFFMVSQIPAEVRRLCAVALAKSRPYKFNARNKAGEWNEIEIFDIQFLCKARSRRSWNHSFVHQDELRRSFANKILGEYAKSIRKGFIDKLQDDETQMKNAYPVQPDSKCPPNRWSAPPSSGSDTDQKKFVRQNSGNYEKPPRMNREYLRKKKTGAHSTSAESESDGEKFNGANPRSKGETGLKVNVNIEKEKEWFPEPRELWSPISPGPGSQRNTSFAPTSTSETNLAPRGDMEGGMKQQQKETNPQVQQFFADFEQFTALQKFQCQQQQQPMQQQQQHQLMQQQQQQVPMQQQQQQLQMQQLYQQFQQLLKQQQPLPYQQQQLPYQQQQLFSQLYQQQQQQKWQKQQQQQQQFGFQPLPQPQQSAELQQMFHMYSDFMRKQQQQQMMARHQSPPSASPAEFQSFLLQPQPFMRMPIQFGGVGPASRSSTFGTKTSRVDDFGSGDEAERDLMKDCDIFGLDEDELRG